MQSLKTWQALKGKLSKKSNDKAGFPESAMESESELVHGVDFCCGSCGSKK